MSKLDALLQQYCPNGVEYKPLKDVSLMQRGTSITKSQAHDGIYPVISGGREPAFYCDAFNRDGETVTVAGSGAGAGYVQYFNEPLFANDCFTVKGLAGISTKYLYYCMTWMQERIFGTKKGGGVPHVHISDIDRFEIPVPPLPVQQEIVRILDGYTEKVTALQAELEAELQLRKKQYEWHRDQLLTFRRDGGPDVPLVRLGDICSLITKGTTPKNFVESGVNFIKTESFVGTRIDRTRLSHVSDEMHFGFLKRSVLQDSDILVSIAGSIGKCVMVTDDILPANTNQALGIIRLLIDEDINKRYVFYVLQSGIMSQYIDKNVKKGSAQPNLTLQHLNDFVFPLPDRKSQDFIVNILDSFNVLVDDISSGLPAEIEARHKQYEYYRDKLFAF